MIVAVLRENNTIWLEDDGKTQSEVDSENIQHQISSKKIYLMDEYERLNGLLFAQYTRGQLDAFFVRKSEAEGFNNNPSFSTPYTDRYSYNRAARTVDPNSNPGLFTAELASVKQQRIDRAVALSNSFVEAKADLDENIEYKLDLLELVDPNGIKAEEQAKLDAIDW